MRHAAWRTCVTLLTIVILAGCVMHSKTLEHAEGTQTIYQVSEREAFITVLDIYAIEVPKQSVDDVAEGKYRGYSADARFWMDWT